MFKILTLAILGFLFYKLVMPAPQIEEPVDDDGEWIDYEEVD